MTPYWLAALLCICAPFARAQDAAAVHDLKAGPGKDVRVGIYTTIRPDCTSGPLPAIRLAAPPAHGAVTVKRATFKATNIKQCLATEVPAFVAFYRAADGFNGPDAFVLEVSWAGGRKEMQRFQMTVSSNPGGGQGI